MFCQITQQIAADTLARDTVVTQVQSDKGIVADFFTQLPGWFTIVTIGGIAIYAIYQILKDFFDFENRRVYEAKEKAALSTVVDNLSSKEYTSRISSAIMLRRYLQTKISRKYPHLQTEAINVIASVLKILPTGVLQKTLADGLAYAIDLSELDLQKSNLQDAYLGQKGKQEIVLSDTDFFMSDLSYALIEKAKGNVIFYRAILYRTKIKNCHFENSNFCEADLSYTTFDDVYLNGANFTGAKNIPEEIKCHLVERDGKYIFNYKEPITIKAPTVQKEIFMSVPSIMSKENELLAKDYEAFLNDEGYIVHYYIRDDYPQYGQLNKIKEKIMTSAGMVVFGFKQTHILKAVYRPDTEQEEVLDNKWLSTPWNEIEVGMGIMRGLPIMMVKDPTIENGVFDSHLSECFVSTISTEVDSRRLSDNKEMRNWLSRL